MDRKLNRQDWEKRDELIFGEPQLYLPGRTINFEKLNYATLQKLIDMNFIDLRDQQNDAPSIGEFLDIIKEHPDNITLHGYVVGPQRVDYRVSIEGLLAKWEGPIPEWVVKLVNRLYHANGFDFSMNHLYVWYD